MHHWHRWREKLDLKWSKGTLLQGRGLPQGQLLLLDFTWLTVLSSSHTSFITCLLQVLWILFPLSFFCVEQVHFLGSRCSLISVVSSQHQFQLPPWSRYCWVMRTFQYLLSLKCFRTTHITPHTSPCREACPGLSRGKIAAAVMFPNLPFLGLRDWDHLWRHVELVKWISSFLQSSMSKPSSLRRAHTSHQWVLLLLCLERKLADLQTISVLWRKRLQKMICGGESMCSWTLSDTTIPEAYDVGNVLYLGLCMWLNILFILHLLQKLS